jgi:Fe-S-cluster containining protein
VAGPFDGGEARAEVAAALEAIYAELPSIDCRRLCHPACGPIVMSRAEGARIASVAGEREAADDLVCPYLERASGLCGVYELRPLICRLWGATESLRCEWGCEPSAALSDAEVKRLIERVLALSDGDSVTVWRGWERMLERAGGG